MNIVKKIMLATCLFAATSAKVYAFGSADLGYLGIQVAGGVAIEKSIHNQPTWFALVGIAGIALAKYFAHMGYTEFLMANKYRLDGRVNNIFIGTAVSLAAGLAAYYLESNEVDNAADKKKMQEQH